MQLDDIVQSPECRQFGEIWKGWRGTELVPRRSSVRIEEIPDLLPFISVLEVLSRDVVRFRLVGTGFFEATGYDLTGNNFIDLTTPERQEQRKSRVEEMITRPCGSYVVYSMVYTTGRVVPTEVLSLPVFQEGKDSLPQIFAVSAPMENLGKNRFDPNRNNLPSSKDFQFVDIGAGISDAD